MNNRRPVSEIMAKVKEVIKENGYGALSLSDKIVSTGIKKDMNRGRIERAFYHGVNQLSYVQSLDDTLEAILTLFGLDSKDIYLMLLNNDTKGYSEEEKMFMEFVKDPKAKPFIKLAMAQYKLKQAEDEIKKI